MDKDKPDEQIGIRNTKISNNIYIETLERIKGMHKIIGRYFCSKDNQEGKARKYIHYTSLTSFHAMTKPFSEDGEDYVLLFPSRVQFLNDSSEFSMGLSVIKNNAEWLNKIGIKKLSDLNLRDDAYTVSFCGEDDLLSQWKYYGKESGVAIEFDFGSDKPLCKFLWTQMRDKSKTEEEEWAYNNNFAYKQMPYRVIYGRNNQNILYRKIINFICRSRQHKEIILNSFIPYCKDISFFEEKESRLLFYPVDDNGDISEIKTPIKHRAANSKIVPQFECRVFYANATAENRPPIPIKNIMVGPGYNQVMVFNGIIDTIEHGDRATGYLDEYKIAQIKKNGKRINYDKIQDIDRKEVCVVVKKEYGEDLEYVTYKTANGVTVQLSATPFRS